MLDQGGALLPKAGSPRPIFLLEGKRGEVRKLQRYVRVFFTKGFPVNSQATLVERPGGLWLALLLIERSEVVKRARSLRMKRTQRLLDNGEVASGTTPRQMRTGLEPGRDLQGY